MDYYTVYSGDDAAELSIPAAPSDVGRYVQLFTSQDPTQADYTPPIYDDRPSPLHAPSLNPWQEQPQPQPQSQYSLPYEHLVVDAQHTLYTPTLFPAEPELTQTFIQASEPQVHSIHHLACPSPVQGAQFSQVYDIQSQLHYTDADATLSDDDYGHHGHLARTGYLDHLVPEVPDLRSDALVVGEEDFYTSRGGAAQLEGCYVENDLGDAPSPFDDTQGTSSPNFLFASPSPPPLIQHVPVPPHHRSAYSELSAHVACLSKTSQSPPSPTQAQAQEHAQTDTQPRAPTQPQRSRRTYSPASPSIPPPPPDSSSSPFYARGQPRYSRPSNSELLPPISTTSRAGSPFSPASDSSPSSYSPPTPPGAAHNISRLRTLSVRTAYDVAYAGRRAPSLACFFCRERKIACGRPAEGSVDMTCNQCRRRANACDYPKESHRGQHRRGTGRGGGGGAGVGREIRARGGAKGSG